MSESVETPASQPSKADLIKQIKSRLDSVIPQFDILRPQEFCNDEAYLDGLSTDNIEFIAKVSALEPVVLHAGLLSQRSEKELMKSVRTKSAADLELSLILGSLAIKTMHKEDPNRGIIVSMFGRALRWKWQLNNKENAKQLDDAIYYFQKTVEIEPEDEANRALHFDDLGCALWERYTRKHDNDDFQSSKEAFENAVNIPHSGKPMFLSNLGKLYKDKALFSPNEKDELLKKSITVHLEAINCVASGFLGSIRSLHRNLAVSYLELHPVEDVGTELDTAVEEGVITSGQAWMFRYELAAMLTDRFRKSGLQAEADMSISLLRKALPEATDQVIVKSALADVLEQKGLSIGSPDMVAEALEFSQQALNVLSEYNADFFRVSLNTGILLARQYLHTGDAEYIEKAVTVTRRALASPFIGQHKWKFEQILGIQLGYRYQATENASDLDEGITLLKGTIDTAVTGLTSFDRGTSLNHYGRSLHERYKLSRKPQDLDLAIESLKASIVEFGPEESSITDVYNDLGNTSSSLFETTGKVEDIHEVVEYYKKALSSAEKFPLMVRSKPMYYFGLGNAFFSRFQTWDQAADLNQSIVFYEEAVKNTHPGDMRQFSRVRSLCWTLLHRCRVTNDRKSLVAAQKTLQETLEGPPIPNAQHISFLQNILGMSYLIEYDRSDNDVSFFDKAAECFYAAAHSGSTIAKEIYPPTINLLKTSIGKYSKTRNPVDFAKVVEQFGKLQQIVLLENASIREMHGLTNILADLAVQIYDIQNIPQFGMVALRIFTVVAAEQAAFPEIRLFAFMQCSRLAYELTQSADVARRCLVKALEILPEAILIGPNRSDQLRSAKRLSVLPRFLLSFSIAAGDNPADTLVLYEQSRSILWNRLIDSKTDLSRLREVDGELAKKFEQIRINLSRASSQAVVTGTSIDDRVKHHVLNNEYRETLRLIRATKGFERFLLLDEAKDLIPHAANGPIVILNSTKYRGDALIVTPEGVINVPLPHFIQDTAIEKSVQVILASRQAGINPQRAFTMFQEVMIWLWDVVASPIFEKLGFLGRKSDDDLLPRVWWVSSTWFAHLPIHAAGDHAKAMQTGEACTVMDRVVSSYIPTLRALDFVRQSASKFAASKTGSGSVLLVKMPTTPDDVDLPGASQEIESVAESLNPNLDIKVLNRPKRQEVVSALQKASMAHIACHGTAEQDDPSLSKIKFQDWKTNPFDVRFLLRNSAFKNLELVYLSACETDGRYSIHHRICMEDRGQRV
ncbi:hypothetical protein CPC08DRAFT_151912 [Agrocybe pediades]|nr:hypothetical protein CPC08DRAFT_151912 [Agrocybe pediades]